MQGIVSLAVVKETQPKKIHKFFKSLVNDTQALETIWKINQVDGFIRPTLDKLPGIWANLIRLDDDWQKWVIP